MGYLRLDRSSTNKIYRKHYTLPTRVIRTTSFCLVGDFCGLSRVAFVGNLRLGISLSGLRQYKQRAESCRVSRLLAGQEKTVSKILSRPLTSVRRYGVTLAMTIVSVIGKGRPWQLFQTLALHVRLAVIEIYRYFNAPVTRGFYAYSSKDSR